jgi:hypothetical protein
MICGAGRARLGAPLMPHRDQSIARAIHGRVLKAVCLALRWRDRRLVRHSAGMRGRIPEAPSIDPQQRLFEARASLSRQPGWRTGHSWSPVGADEGKATGLSARAGPLQMAASALAASVLLEGYHRDRDGRDDPQLMLGLVIHRRVLVRSRVNRPAAAGFRLRTKATLAGRVSIEP